MTRTVGVRTVSKSKSRAARGSIPTGCKGPCKTHTLDIIKTVHRDGRGAGLLSNVDKGDDLGNREGRRIRISKMLIRGKVWLDMTNSVAPGSNLTKIWIVKDRRPGKELVAFNALFDMTDSEPLTALVKMDYRDRFIVVKDMVFDLHGGKDFRVSEFEFDEMMNINCDTLFSHEDEGNMDHTLENGIVIYYACSSSTHTTQITAQCRLYFYDSTTN